MARTGPESVGATIGDGKSSYNSDPIPSVLSAGGKTVTGPEAVGAEVTRSLGHNEPQHANHIVKGA